MEEEESSQGGEGGEGEELVLSFTPAALFEIQ